MQRSINQHVVVFCIPFGEQTCCLPSLLDVAASTNGVISETSLLWEGVLADHALISSKCVPLFVEQMAAKTRWICTDIEECIQWLAKQFIPVFTLLGAFHSVLGRISGRVAAFVAMNNCLCSYAIFMRA